MRQFIIAMLVLGSVFGLIVGYNRWQARRLPPQFKATQSVDRLYQECASLIEQNKRDGKELWLTNELTGFTNILSLRPQWVTVRELDGILSCDIATSGGFSHQGFLWFSKDVIDTSRLAFSFHVTLLSPRLARYSE